VVNPYYTVARAIDGDTLEMRDGTRVRMLGIDTPERGQCGYKEAKELLTSLVDNKTVLTVKGGKTDKDKYGRIVRYVEYNKQDINLLMIKSGWAKARYDSRDGYGKHLREAEYIKADAENPSPCDS
jgi:endonuclease YncB( thermonuclease family)